MDEQKNQPKNIFLIVVGIVVLCISGSFALRWGVEELFSSAHNFSDFPAYQFSASVMKSGGDPYNIAAVTEVATQENEALSKVVAPFRHSPFVLLPFVALDSLPYAHARQVWIGLVFLSVVCISFLLLKFLSPWEYKDPRSWLLSVLPLVFAPLIYSVGLHQLNTFLLVALLAGFISLKREKYIIATAFFGFAIAGKFFLGVVVLAFLFQKKYRLVLFSVVFSVLFFLLPFLFFPQTFDGYTRTVVPELTSGVLHDNPLNPVKGSGSIAWWKNISLNGFATRAFTFNDVVRPLVDAPAIAHTLKIIGYAIFLATFYLLWRIRKTLQIHPVSGFVFASGFLLTAWFLASSFAWQHHLVFLLLFTGALTIFPLKNYMPKIAWVCLGVGLLGMNVLASPPPHVHTWIQQVYVFLPTAGLLLFWAGLVLIGWELKIPEKART